MHPDDLLYPALFYKDTAYFLERSEKHTGSYFGGPFEGSFEGIKHGPQPLHHIATITGSAFEPLQHVIGGGEIRLIYGICYEGCWLRYRNSAIDMDVLEIEPVQSSEDWPYRDYSRYLPYFPMRIGRSFPCNLEQFNQLSCQPLSATDREVIVIVPPSPVLGVSIWGPTGDAECVQMVFRCNLETREVEAFNQCG